MARKLMMNLISGWIKIKKLRFKRNFFSFYL